MQKLWLSLIALLAFPAAAQSPCPAGFHCSYTYTLHWKPVVPATVVITWSTTEGGPIDHTRTVSSLDGSAAFEVAEGTWYVRVTVSSQDGSIAPLVVTYKMIYPTTPAPLTPTPRAPFDFQIAQHEGAIL